MIKTVRNHFQPILDSPYFIAFAVSLPSFIFNSNLWLWMGLAVLISANTKNLKFYFLAAMTFYFWIFRTTLLKVEKAQEINQIFQSAIPLPFIILGIFAVVLLTVFIFYRRSSDFIRTLFPYLIALLYIGALCVRNLDLISQHSRLWVFFRAYWSVLISNILYFMLLMRQSQITLWDVFFIRPFWAGYLPVPGTYAELRQSESKDNLQQVRWRGLVLIFAYTFALILADLIKALFLQDYHIKQTFFSGLSELYSIPLMYDIKLTEQFQKNLLLDAVLAPTVRYSVFFIESVSAIGLQVGFLKTMGFDITESFVSPWKSTSFFDFFKRIHVYFARFITELFILPLFSMFGFIRNFNLRMGLSTFFSVLFFGLFFQIVVIQEDNFLKTNLSLSTFEAFPRVISYYLIISFLVAMSFVLNSGNLKTQKPQKKIWLWLRNVVYYFLYIVMAYYLLIGAYQLLLSTKNTQLLPPSPLFWLRR